MNKIKRCYVDTTESFHDLSVVDVTASDDCICFYLNDSCVLEVPTRVIKSIKFVEE